MCRETDVGEGSPFHEVLSPGPLGMGRMARILVAENNTSNSAVVLAQLQMLGYESTAVTNGSEAVEALERESYSLVLMDCEMPVMDGFEATSLIRRSIQPEIPIIALTANAMPEDRDRCLRGGMSDYLAKPIDLRQLADVLARWLPSLGTFESSTIDAAQPPEQPAAKVERVIFDGEAFLSRVMGDRHLAGIVLKEFVRDVPAQLRNLCQRLEEADTQGTCFQAHTIKGSSATVAAEGLHAIAVAMELAGKTGRLDRCEELVPRAFEEFELFKSTLERTGWI
jgi:two-component system sensor histidine kinase/response regulator